MDDTRSIPRAKYVLHIVTLVALTLLSWFLMMTVHELGHIVAAWTTGGKVTAVVLHPFAFSRTDVSPNPEPLMVAWAGPVIGVLIPLLLWLVARLLRKSFAWLFQFFAVFCMLLNGIYIGIGWTQRIGDAGDMLRLGSERWQLALFGAACVITAIVCSRGMEQRLRLKNSACDASPRVAITLTGVLVCTAILMAWLSPVV